MFKLGTEADVVISSIDEGIFEIANIGIPYLFRREYSNTETTVPETLDDIALLISEGGFIFRGHVIRSK